MPLTQAIRQTLAYHAERGRDVLPVGAVFELLRPYTVNLSFGKELWKSSNPWKAFVICCTAPDNTARYWTVEKSIPGKRARMLKSDTIRLKHQVKKPAK